MSVFFPEPRKTTVVNIYTKFMNYGQCLDFCIWRMWLQFNVEIKYMHWFLLQISMFELSSVSISELHTNPAIPNNASLDPFETPPSLIAGLVTFFNALHLNHGHRRTPNPLESGWKKGGTILPSMGKNLLLTELTA